MRSKLVFLVVFMLSFVIVHDTVLTMIDHNNKAGVISSLESYTVSEASTDIHQLHNMFHFVALVYTEFPSMDIHTKKQTIEYYIPEYILPYKKSIIKPPIV